MILDTIEISDRTDVDFLIGEDRFNVSIRDGKLRVSVDGQIAIYPDAANVVKIDVLSYGNASRDRR